MWLDVRLEPCDQSARRVRFATRTTLAFVVIFSIFHTLACKPEDGTAPRAGAPPIIALGGMLFRDTSLSADGRVSCATCHVPERAYSDGLAHASGVSGHQGTRNTPTILDVG